MTRSIPPALAPLVERLELERPSMITSEALTAMIRDARIATPPRVAIQRLSERGWLLKTGVRGVWEFAPGERAGAYSARNPFSALQATLMAQPRLRARAALGSALWLLDFADRAPDRHEVSVPSGEGVPAALKRAYRVVRFEPRLAPAFVQGVPVHQTATVLVHMAHRPTDVRSWAEMLEHLPKLVAAANESEIREELAGRPNATLVRLAYLLSGSAPDLTARLRIEPAGVVWFGPRRKVRRSDSRWKVVDTVLPFSPAQLSQ